MFNLFYLKKEDQETNFTAFFMGQISSDRSNIITQLSNILGSYDTILMIWRDSIFELNNHEIMLLSIQKL